MSQGRSGGPVERSMRPGAEAFFIHFIFASNLDIKILPLLIAQKLSFTHYYPNGIFIATVRI